uniref:Uncharacterized protein n=1 Tax=Setaria viridis TaxID=4556 RepID=A0A4U6VQ06_SETVI|nr:hypothetical protein SEVIR_3G203850v2 [Setaria viridis]
MFLMYVRISVFLVYSMLENSGHCVSCVLFNYGYSLCFYSRYPYNIWLVEEVPH